MITIDEASEIDEKTWNELLLSAERVGGKITLIETSLEEGQE